MVLFCKNVRTLKGVFLQNALNVFLQWTPPPCPAAARHLSLPPSGFQLLYFHLLVAKGL